MKKILSSFFLAVCLWQCGSIVHAQSLPFDSSITNYFLARATNSIDNASEVDSWSFDALAGDVVSISVETPTGALDPYVEMRNSANGLLASDEDSGPGADASITTFTMTSSGR